MMIRQMILVYTDDDIILNALPLEMDAEIYDIHFIDNPNEIDKEMNQRKVDLIVYDLNIAGPDYGKHIENAKNIEPDVGVIVLSDGENNAKTIGNLMKLGVNDYIEPEDAEELAECIKFRLEEKKIKNGKNKALNREMMDRIESLESQLYEVLNQKEMLEKEGVLLKYELEKKKASIFKFNKDIEQLSVKAGEWERSLYRWKKWNNDDLKNIRNAMLKRLSMEICPLLDEMSTWNIDDNYISQIKMLKSEIEALPDIFDMENLAPKIIFTKRQKQIAYKIKDKKTSKEIADFLKISSSTIDTQRRIMRKKLGIAKTDIDLRDALIEQWANTNLVDII